MTAEHVTLHMSFLNQCKLWREGESKGWRETGWVVGRKGGREQGERWGRRKERKEGRNRGRQAGRGVREM